MAPWLGRVERAALAQLGAARLDALRKLDLLVCQELFLTETAALAHVVLPVASAMEKSGTFTNTDRRVQRVRQAIPPQGLARPDWQIIQSLATQLTRNTRGVVDVDNQLVVTPPTATVPSAWSSHAPLRAPAMIAPTARP